MSGKGITTVIVSNGMEPLLDLCLHHLERALRAGGRDETDQTVLIDNASVPPYGREGFAGRNAQLVRYDVHHSFSACCNAGMRLAPNAYYLMLNNDVVLHEQAINSMLAVLESDERIGVCGARLVYPNGTVQHCGMRLGPMELGPYHVHKHRPTTDVPRETVAYQAVTAACVLLRHEMVVELGGYDESFPFAWEDVDLCLRARMKGWGVVCCNQVDSIHFESMTPGREERDPPSREVFERRWAGKWSVDG